MSNLVVIENDEEGQFITETEDGDYVGVIMYTLRPAYLDIWHTEVDPVWEGQGMAGKMATAVLTVIRGKNMKIFPRCPFLEGYIERHPEFKDLIYV